VVASRSDMPMSRARAVARAAQRREQERAAHRKERRIRRRERQEQHSEEYRLREQQGLSPPTTPENSSSSSEEEEESDGGRDPREVESPTPVTKGRRGSRGADAHGGRGGTRYRAVCGRGGAWRRGAGERCRGIWERCGGDDGRHNSACRTLEEEEAGLLQLEVSGPVPRHPQFRWVGA
jgi:hypothetical protein